MAEIHEKAWTVEHIIIVKSFNKWGIGSVLDSNRDEVMWDKNENLDNKNSTDRSCFLPGLHSWKVTQILIVQIVHKIPI